MAGWSNGLSPFCLPFYNVLDTASGILNVLGEFCTVAAATVSHRAVHPYGDL